MIILTQVEYYLVTHFNSFYIKANKPKKINVNRNFYPRLYKNPENIYLKEIKRTEKQNKKFKLYDKKTGFFRQPKIKNIVKEIIIILTIIMKIIMKK